MQSKSKITQQDIKNLIVEDESYVWNNIMTTNIISQFGWEWDSYRHGKWKWEDELVLFLQHLENVSKLTPFYLLMLKSKIENPRF